MEPQSSIQFESGTVKMGFIAKPRTDGKDATADVDYFYTSRLQGEPAGGGDDIHTHPTLPRSAGCAWLWVSDAIRQRLGL